MSLDKETVALPFVSGVQPSTRARLLNPDKLLVAENCQYVLDQGPQRRNGHLGRVVRSSKPYTDLNGTAVPTAAQPRAIFSTTNPGLPATWLYGWGVHGTERAQDIINFETSPYPDVGQLFGSASRDDEALTWDGFRLFSYTPGQTAKFGEATKIDSPLDTNIYRQTGCFPAMRVQPQGKVSAAQLMPDACDNGILRLIAWVNPGAASFSYSAFDSDSGAAVVVNQTVTGSAIKGFRCICVGQWFHILYADSGANSMNVLSFHQDTPSSTTTRSLGTVDNVFDVRKFSEQKFVVFRLKVGVISGTILNADGTTLTTLTPNLGGNTAVTNGPIAINIQESGHIGLVWLTGAGPFTLCFCLYEHSGVQKNGTFGSVVGGVTAARRLTCAPRTIPFQTQPDDPIWSVYVEDLVSSVHRVTAWNVLPGAGFQQSYIRRRVVLASHAFSVGNRTYTWVASSLNGAIGLQTTWFLVDDDVLPVGKMSYGQAAADLAGTTYGLTSVNWHTDDLEHPFKDRIVHHGALGYFQRVPSVTSTIDFTPNGVFAEPSINFYELDFLPPLRSAQAGRTTYIAGAQLWAYDGSEAVEAGFHMAPEGVTLGAPVAGGSLSAGTYRWRVDLCHKNAQNEEVRSWSIITAPVVAGANQKVLVTIPTMPMTRRLNSYFLIFRTEANGTVYYLVNSRDPSSANFVLNNLNNDSMTFDDGLSDASLLAREYHPANAGGNYVHPLPPPACEIVASGRSRLWLAGGELSRGEIAPSRLFSPGQAPAFSPALNIQVDRNFEPITGVGFVGDIGIFFRKTSAYVLDSDGPDNSFVGVWTDPRLAIAETGCVAQETLAVTSVGMWFQAPAGIRLLGNSGSMDRVAGTEMDQIAKDGNYSAAVVVPELTQVRWYSRDISKPTIVLNYSTNSWTTWVGTTCVGAIFWPVSNFAVIAKGDGYIWEEREGVYTDNGNSYTMKLQTSWLHAAQLGDFQRIRRFALFGKCALGVKVTLQLYYDERPFHDEEMTIQMPDSLNSVVGGNQFNGTIWGLNAGSFGNLGPWGDEATAHVEHGNELWFRDGVFRIRKRPGRQKCSVFSLSISDNGTTTSGVEPIVLALEIARKPGLDRIPNSTNNLA